MNRIKSIIKEANFDHRVFAFSMMYSVWEISEVILRELYRNLGLATVAIYFATLLLLSNFRGSLLCLISVILTLVNVSGIMHFLGLSIDGVTSTALIICIGLSVDFAVHVVHTFTQTPVECGDIRPRVTPEHDNVTSDSTTSNDKTCWSYCYNQEKTIRMRKSLEAIAPAVLNGGLSTLLAVVLLAFSEMYVFTAFFKIFVLVVSCGLYNGLVVLPVLLANIGPECRDIYKKADEPTSKDLEGN